MFFRRDPRQKALLEMATKQVEKVLREMQDEGADLAKLRIKKYQKTHYTTCACPLCLEAQRRKDPRLRGILEDGFKVFTGEGGEDE